MKKFWIGLSIGFCLLFVLGAMDFDRDYNFTTYGDFSGGKNEFSSPANVKDNQAINLENFLFYGSQLRARKGILDLNTVGFGSSSFADTVDVGASANDCNHGDDVFNDDSTFYYLANQSAPDYTGGIRFVTVGVSQGATIDSAFLKLSTLTTCSGGECKTIIYGSDEDDAASFSVDNTPADRTKTTASETYKSSNSDTPNGEFFITLTVTDIVQEVVDRSAWDTNNSMAFLIEDDGTTGSGKKIKWYTYDHVSNTAPNLKVFYSEVTGKGITGVYEFRKSDEFSQIIATSNGAVWIYDEETEKFADFLKENIDSVARVRVTQNDSSVTGVPDSTFFTQLGYDDSIAIYLNDSLHYIYQILHDTLLYLYEDFEGDTDSTGLFNAPVTVPIDVATIFDVWMNNLFIVGSRQVIVYDGDLVDTSASDTLTFTITDTCRVDEVFKVKTSPTPSAAGYEPGDLEGYYVVGYNDDTSGVGGNHALNIPLRIANNTADFIWILIDTSFTANIPHIDDGSVFRIRPPFTSEYRVCEGIIDMIRDDGDTAYYVIYNIYDHSVFSGYDSTAFDFGYHYYKHMDSEEGEFETTCRFQSMGTGDSNYLYVACLKEMTNLPTVGDTFEIWRKVSSSQRDAPSLITHWQDRQWRAGYPDDPSLLRWSVDLEPDSFPVSYWVVVNQDDGDVLTALVPLSFQDVLLAFKTKHIYCVTTSGIDPYDFPITDLVDGIGTPAPVSVISYGQAVYFYDYTGFYRYNLSGMPQKISWQIEETVADSINKDYAHLIVGGYFDQHLWWSYPSGSATKNNRTKLYNLEDQAWTTVDINASAYFVGQIETDSIGVLIGDPDSGKVYRYGLSYFDNGDSIDAFYESPWLDMGDEYDFIKDFKDNQFLFDKHDSTKIYIDYYKDYGTSVVWTDTIGIDTNSVLTYHKRAIEGDMLAQRIKLKIRVTRIDDTFQMPFYRIKWKPVGEVRYDE